MIAADQIHRLSAMRFAATRAEAQTLAGEYLGWLDTHPDFTIPVQLECEAFDRLNALHTLEGIRKQ